ncbi:RraA family protein [Lachnospiraceae bacterium]|nr:RraA family protein [Lachnospiraceae bacterium]
MKEQIIQYIKENRVSTTEIADCMGKSGLLENANALNKGKFKVGNVKWVYAYNESNWPLHEQIQEVNTKDIVMIEAFHCGKRATIGELVAKYLLLYRGAAAIISNTNMRDGARLIKENYPIWCKGLTPIGCFNTQIKKPLEDRLLEEHRETYDGSIAVCDDSGVVIIPQKYHTPEFLQKVKQIEEQEDIWFECLDHKKWNTFDIVCRKKYLD